MPPASCGYSAPTASQRQRPAALAMHLGRAAGDFRVRERQLAVADLLIILVAFAGHQHHVARLGLGNCQFDRRGAIRLDHVVAAHAAEDLVDDVERRLMARIVGSDHNFICKPLGYGSHKRTFARITITTTSKNDH